jgi:periplasmic protein TonB
MLHYYTHGTLTSTSNPPQFGFDAADTSGTRVQDLAIDSNDGTAAAEATRAPAPALAAPVRPGVGGTATDKRALLAALGLAAMAHVAILYILARVPDEPMFGAGGHEIDAVSVTLISSKVLDSRDTVLSHPSAQASASAVAATDGSPDKEPAEAAVERRDDKTREEAREEKKREEEPVSTAEAILPVPKEAAKHKQQEAHTAGGGAEALSNAASNSPARAPATASAGVVRQYAHDVAQALRKAKPKGMGGAGTVRVKFSIDPDGSVVSVEISKSSGNPKLDEKVVEAVRKTKFQTPPLGLSSAERFYELPYYFR